MASPQKNDLLSNFAVALSFFLLIVGMSIFYMTSSNEPRFLDAEGNAIELEPLQPARGLSPIDAIPTPLATAAADSDSHKSAAIDAPNSQSQTTSRPRLNQRERDKQGASDASTDEQLEQAVAKIDSGHWQEAEPLLQKILEEHPDHEGALVELTMIYLLDRKDSQGALPYLKRALTANANNDSLISELLSIHDESGTPQEAVDFLRGLTQEQPDNRNLDYGMAQALLRADKPQEAIEYLQRSAESRDGIEREEVLEQLGDTYSDLGLRDQAIDSWRETVERHKAYLEAQPDDREYIQDKIMSVQIKLASSLVDSERYEEAEAIYKELKKQAPKDEWVIAFGKKLQDRRL